MNPSPEADASSDGVLVIRAVGTGDPGDAWRFRVTWRRDGEQVSHPTALPEELHRLVDDWLGGLAGAAD